MIRVKSAEDQGLALDVIQIDGGTQSRAALNQHVVDDYAEAIKAGAMFPPIVVFYDGKKHWLADGFHRFHAYQKAGKAKVAADVRQGTRRDAILHSVGANEAHGLRRTNDDKRRAVETLLNDLEWSKWSDGEIAKRCAVSREYVNRLRPTVTCDQVTSERTYVTKHGTVATMQTAGINASRKNAREALVNDEPSPEAGPQAEAFQSQGTGAGTLADREGRHEGEAASVDLPTIPRNIVAEVRELWNLATPSERDEIRAIINSASDGGPEGRKRLQVAREPINAAEPDAGQSKREEIGTERGVSPSVTAGETALEFHRHASPETGSAGDPSPTHGEKDLVEAGTGHNCAVLPQEPCTAEITPSAAPPAEAVAARPASQPSATAPHSNPQPTSSPEADKPEPVANGSGTNQRPAYSAVADGQPSIPTDDARGAGRGAKVPHSSPQSTGAVTNLNPRCQKPATCKWAKSQASCAACNDAWMRERVA